MPKLSDLLAERAKADVQVGGETVEFNFFVLWRERFTEAEWTELLASEGLEYYKRLLPRVVQSWNLEADDNSQVPVTPDAIEQHHVPLVLLAAIERRALSADLSGKVRASANGSLAT